MINITIDGPQGEGKTLIAAVIQAALRLAGKTSIIYDGDDIGKHRGRIPYGRLADVIIVCQIPEDPKSSRRPR